MSLSRKVVLVAMACILLLAANVSAQEVKKSAIPAYLLSIFLGYGTGHFYLGSDHAVRHLVIDLGVLAVEITGGVLIVSSGVNGSLTGVGVGYVIVVAGSLAAVGAKIWEIVDIFGEVDKKRAEGKVVLEPQIGISNLGVTLGVSYKY